jgi:glutamate-1-semialdehyde 2,1-aminomutase
VEAKYRQMRMGLFNRHVIEVECAELLVDIIDGAEMAKFAKNGSDVTTAQSSLLVRTWRDLVAICGIIPFIPWTTGS